MKKFKNIKSKESKFSQDCSRALYYFIKKHPVKYPSNIKELMDICRLECDFKSVKTYQQFHNFLQRHRKYTDNLFSILTDEGWFDKYKKDGLIDEEIYKRFIDVCISYEIIPLYYDGADGDYKLIDLHSFLLLKKERLFAVATELKHKGEAYTSMEKVLPDTIHSEIEIRKESPEVKKLLDARKELNKFLPVGNKE